MTMLLLPCQAKPSRTHHPASVAAEKAIPVFCCFLWRIDFIAQMSFPYHHHIQLRQVSPFFMWLWPSLISHCLLFLWLQQLKASTAVAMTDLGQVNIRKINWFATSSFPLHLWSFCQEKMMGRWNKRVFTKLGKKIRQYSWATSRYAGDYLVILPIGMHSTGYQNWA